MILAPVSNRIARNVTLCVPNLTALLKMDSPEAQANFLGNFRADSIVEDCEAVSFFFFSSAEMNEMRTPIYACGMVSQMG